MSKLIQIYEPGQTPLPHADSAAIGIDLGTTHSVVAIATDGAAEAIHDAHGRAIIPSVVHYDGAHVVVGHEARRAQAEGEADVIASIKRLMGKSAEDLQDSGEAAAYTLDAQASGLVRVKAAGRSLTPVEISSEVLKHLRHMAEEALGRDVSKAVITVPAYFDDAARAATKDAAKLAGLEVLRLINEPTAAALAYGLDANAQGVFAIYDFGGGTFDISVLKLEQGVFQVLSTAGDTELGGDDMDRAIAAHVLQKRGLNVPEPALYAQLLSAARAAKEELTGSAQAGVLWEGERTPLGRAEFEAMVETLVARTLDCCADALREAGIEPTAMDGVVLVGGSTRIPLVKAKVGEFFGRTPHDKLDPDLVVALGAALQAEALTRGSDNLLLDVTPLSLGLETMGGIVEKIIHRNSPIPTAVAQEFTTYQDGQTALKVHVVQGEREKVEDCRSLAQFVLRGIPPMAAGLARIRITFTIDADGLLSVAAEELTTGAKQQVDVQPSYGLAFEEIERMLRDSMENARADILERLLIEARVEAQRTLQDVANAMARDGALLRPGEREMIEAQCLRISTAIAGSDRDKIDHEVKQLDHVVGSFAQRRMDAAIAGALVSKPVDAIE
ncbi:MAG: Fe-S protein assembly chaperone HscA [Azospirillum brasilense]|nr:MAG: Fe-S protein assembly chaperone HscA [Azospirillum brasilense]